MALLTQQQRLIRISGRASSSQRAIFFDLINNPDEYKGYIVYISEVDDCEPEKYAPFKEAKKFYFNEDGQWQSSDFYKGHLVPKINLLTETECPILTESGNKLLV